MADNNETGTISDFSDDSLEELELWEKEGPPADGVSERPDIVPSTEAPISMSPLNLMEIYSGGRASGRIVQGFRFTIPHPDKPDERLILTWPNISCVRESSEPTQEVHATVEEKQIIDRAADCARRLGVFQDIQASQTSAVPDEFQHAVARLKREAWVSFGELFDLFRERPTMKLVD